MGPRGHPTCFYNPNPRCPDQRRFLITEALRGKNVGGILTLSRHSREDFVKALGYHPQGSASTRDVVARAIDTEMKKRGSALPLGCQMGAGRGLPPGCRTCG